MDSSKITASSQDNTPLLLPFDIRLSLEKVFHFWEEKAGDEISTEQDHAIAILEQTKVLRKEDIDVEQIAKHPKEVQLLLSALFPEFLSDSEVKAASLPFLPDFFFQSNKLKRLVSKAGPDFKIEVKDIAPDDFYILACSRIIEMVYDVPVNFRYPMNVDIPDDETTTMHHFKVMRNSDFSAIIPKENTKALSLEDIRLLMDNSHDIELWKKMIPPGSYIYKGMHILSFFDQTEEVALSELKRLLLQSNALQEHEIVELIEHQLARYLNIEKIEIGFDAFDENGCVIRALHGLATSSRLLEDTLESSVDEWYCDNAFDGLLKRNEVYTSSNRDEMLKSSSVFVKRMFEKGVGSFIIAPLRHNDRIIAFIELTSNKEGILNSMVASKLKNVLPIFSMVVGRAIDMHQMHLDSIIQDKYTALHPTVTWKFLQAAESIFQEQFTGKPGDTDIHFQEVYPLYGQFDIRGSSDMRNATIRADLSEQLNLAGEVLDVALDHYKLPIYQQMQFRVDQFRASLEDALQASDEVSIVDFMRHELEPVIQYLKTQAHTKGIVQQYLQSLDPKLGVIYKQRKEYEQSVHLINHRIAEYLNQQQALAQRMFPHYFDKFRTDGVEYNAFIGQSLVQSKTLDPLHLKNLRLWQLLVVCGVEHMHRKIKNALPLPMDITSLVLAYGNPMAIRFRQDERRFDVDGAYNVRYEILKKRIDKAYIKGTSERLTQPGKLTIVYSQDREADEYMQYLQYLQAVGYLDTEIEELELEDMQGASGLQAFRLNFSYEKSPDELIREMMVEIA